MKPIAKAENLIEKFTPNTRIWNEEKKVWEDCIESAKRCALITVNEIIGIKLLWFQKDTEILDYWQEVRQELLNVNYPRA